MSPLPTIGVNGSGGISASYLNTLIAKTMEQQSQPLVLMQQEQQRLRVQRALYDQLSTLLTNLSTEAGKLKTGSTSVLSNKTVTVSDSTILTATASSGAATGALNISDVVLGAAHQARSRRFDHADTPLGLSGSFHLGGQATRSFTSATYGATVTGFTADATTAVATGQTELGTGQYRVEFQQFGETWKFRLVDGQGQSVGIANAAQSGAYTADWQAYAPAANPEDGSHTFDTGRGLKITFSGADPDGNYLGSSAPSLQYHAQGASITLAATDTLQGLRDKINRATYASGNRVQASIVDNQLVLSAARIGYQLEAADGVEGLLAAGKLDLLGNGDADGDGWAHTVGGWDQVNGKTITSSLKVNGILVNGTGNTGLTDIVSGMTFNLLKPSGSTTVTVAVADDTKAATDQASAFVTQFNKVLSFLQQNTSTTKNGDGSYTRAGLASDSALGSLRLRLVKSLLPAMTGLPANAPTTLSAIGLSLDAKTLQLSLSDSSKFASQLTTNSEGMMALLDGVMGRVTSVLNQFTGSNGLLTTSTSRLSKEDQQLSNRITAMTERLSAQEMLLTRHYARSLAALAQMQSQQSLVYSITSLI